MEEAKKCHRVIRLITLLNSIIEFACSTLFSMYSFSGWSIERHATTWYSHANVTENDILFLFLLKLVVKLCAQHIFLPPALFCQFWKNDRRRNAKKKNATATLLRKSCLFLLYFIHTKFWAKSLLESHVDGLNPPGIGHLLYSEGCTWKEKFPITPGPRLMRIHLVRYSTSARSGKIPQIVLIYSTIATYYSLSAKFRTKWIGRTSWINLH